MPVAHHQVTLRVGGDVVLVRYHHYGDALVRELGEEVHYLDGAFRVEVAGGFVREEDRRLVHERAGDRDTLLLSAGKLRGRVRAASPEPHALEQRAGAGATRGASEPAEVEVRQFHILNRCRAGE